MLADPEEEPRDDDRPGEPEMASTIPALGSLALDSSS
jgi:hypothetical protein